MAQAQNRPSGEDRGTEQRSDRERRQRGTEESAAERTQELKAPAREA
ncbi:hypothetical protein ACWC2K_37345 [Streptomyces chattanoogensis]